MKNEWDIGVPRKYELKINDNIFTITIDRPNGEKLDVTIDETILPVQIIDTNLEKGIFQVTVNDQEHTIHVTPHSNTNEFTVKVQKVEYQASLQSIPTDARPITAPSYSKPITPITKPTIVAAIDPGTVSAPLPGRILEVQVKQDQKVKTGDVLLVLEAMKMANEIRAPLDGTVTEVHIQSGVTVEKGQPLITIQ